MTTTLDDFDPLNGAFFAPQGGSTSPHVRSRTTSPVAGPDSTCPWTTPSPAGSGTVQRHLPRIAYGHTRSYQDVATMVGNPKAVRAVGTACATNPLPIVVPCHRALRADGTLGGYIGGPAAKTALLTLERTA